MAQESPQLILLPCLDSAALAATRRAALDIPRTAAAALGRSAVEAAESGYHLNRDGQQVDWIGAVAAACQAKRSIPTDAPLPTAQRPLFAETRVQVSNETTLGAARPLDQAGLRLLALNFANGIHPGGFFLEGARAQPT